VVVKKHSHPERFLLLAAAFLALLAAMWAGLLRMDLEIPMLQPGLSLAHGPLMVSGFLGVLIGLERAVALNRWWAYGASVLTAAGALCLGAGVAGGTGPGLILLGSAALVTNFVVIVRRQADRKHFLVFRCGDSHAGSLVGGFPGAHHRGRTAGAEPPELAQCRTQFRD
jgi:hypothetical protein